MVTCIDNQTCILFEFMSTTYIQIQIMSLVNAINNSCEWHTNRVLTK
jgi:hypothetical protein